MRPVEMLVVLFTAPNVDAGTICGITRLNRCDCSSAAFDSSASCLSPSSA